MTEKIAFDLRKQNKLTGFVAVKLRYSDIETYTRQQGIAYTNVHNGLLKIAPGFSTSYMERRVHIWLGGICFTNLIPGNYRYNCLKTLRKPLIFTKQLNSSKKQFGEKYVLRAARIS